MASSHGHIGEFNSQLEDWRSYTERMQNYFTANDIKSELKQRAILPACVDLAPTNLSTRYYRHKNPRM